MKSYLSLVPISAKVRKRQNRMTILCVIISIFLVTAIFSVADMMIRTQSDRMTGKNGSWHIELDGISQETALKIAERDDVVSIGAVTIFNPDGELPYRMDGKRVVLYGIDESYLTMNSTGAAEGRFPQGMGEIMLSSNAARVLQVAVGDTVTLRTPSGDWDFTVSGLGGVEESYYSGQYSLMDAYLPRTAFAALMEQNNVHNLQTSYYVQFTSASKAAKAIPELTAQHNLPENAVSENTGVMAIAGQSDSSAAKKARKAIEETILEHSMKYQEVITWSTDGFFRETKEKVAYRKSEGCAVVEMECSALAACADFRGATWGMILYTADSLADVDKYDERNWGGNAYEYALTLCLDAVIKL